MSAVAAIVGSAFDKDPEGLTLDSVEVDTPWGSITFHSVQDCERPAYVRFRHGLPHTLLPNQIPYRAQAWALRELGCQSLLVTSSVGVLDASLPLFRPLIVGDIIMLENRLPDGSACTIFERPAHDQGHLVLTEGLLSGDLSSQVVSLADSIGEPIADGEVIFAYAGGPRTKTRAENRTWSKLGAQVNSMTLAPEVVLANELEIPCCGLVVGHKYSVPGIENPERQSVANSLQDARGAIEKIVASFLTQGRPVNFNNHIFRFGRPRQ